CPTASGFIADQDRATIAKSSTLPHDSAPRGRRIDEEEVATKRVSSDTEEVAVERASEDTKEMEIVLTTMDATTVLASGTAEVLTGSGSIPTTGPPTAKVPTGSDVVPTASLVFATATVQAQQKKPKTKKKKRDFYMAVIRNNLGWKAKDSKGMSFEEVVAKFKTVWEQIEGGVSKISEGEAAWLKRKGIGSEQESAKKQKISEEVPEEVKSFVEVLEEKIKEMMQLVPIEEVYVEALQVKHPIIDWKVHTKGQRAYWKITRLGGSSASYQFFTNLLKHLDRDDLNQLWSLVKETLSKRPATSDKEMEL
nr:hypothetical protein [Tanacetum cinerariifolium]